MYGALADLQGQAIPRLLRHGALHGTPFLALSREGTDLETLVEQRTASGGLASPGPGGALTAAEREGAVRALRVLHQHGVLHGDVRRAVGEVHCTSMQQDSHSV
jgi:hypothetical protein